MAERQISLESIMQRKPVQKRGAPASAAAEAVPVVLITYATSESTIREALEAVVKDGYIAGAPQVIRIERE
jgi:homoserine dehydrogenase